MKDGKLQIGIIGCGGIANQKHLPNLKLLKDKCDLVAFCDLIKERAVTAAKEYGAESAKVYTDYKEVLADKEIDVVHVLTPNVAHAPITIDAFAAGKHVMCEKPMAHTSEDAAKMVEAWKKSGKQFTIGYQNRFRTEVMSMHRMAESGEFGKIYMSKAHAVRRRAVPTWGVFPNKALQGGGPLIDIGTHALDLTLWMLNDYNPVGLSGSVFYELGHLPQAVEGNVFGPWDPKTYEVEDSAFGFIKMGGGSTIFLEASWALNVLEPREASVTLCGTLAGAELRGGGGWGGDAQLIVNRGHAGLLTEEKISAGGAVAYFKGGSSEPGYLEAKQWVEALINNTSPLVKPEEAYAVTRILEAVYKSAQTGKEIRF